MSDAQAVCCPSLPDSGHLVITVAGGATTFLPVSRLTDPSRTRPRRTYVSLPPQPILHRVLPESCPNRRDFAPLISRTDADSLLCQIEIWKVKKLIKRLEAARGNGTSMISLIIRTSPSPWRTALGPHFATSLMLTDLVTAPKDQVSRAAKMLAEEYVRHFPTDKLQVAFHHRTC